MRAQEEGGRPQDKERGLRGNQACHYFKLRFLDSRTMGKKKKTIIQASHSMVFCYGNPSKPTQYQT